MDLLRYALQYISLGFLVLPLYRPLGENECACKKGKNCASPGKHPYTPFVKRGVKDASNDKTLVTKWFGQKTPLNLGIAAGKKSGIFVVDLDGVLGVESLLQLEKRHAPLPKTLRVRTSSGGEHRYYLFETGLKNQAKQSEIENLDIRTDGGYVVAPPSLHPSGVHYRWVDGFGPKDTKPEKAPAWFLQKIRPAPLPCPNSVPKRNGIPTPQRNGNADQKTRARAYANTCDPSLSGSGGHASAFRAICKIVRGFSLTEEEALDVLREWNGRCKPPWSERELRHKIKEAILKGKDEWGGLLSPVPGSLSERTLPANNAQTPPSALLGESEEEEAVSALNRNHAVAILGSMTVILRECYDYDEGREVVKFMRKGDFELFHQNKTFFDGKKIQRATTAWFRSQKRRTYSQIVFDPSGTPPKDCYNLWKGFAVTPRKGDWSLFREHIAQNIANGNKEIFHWILHFMADACQGASPKPGVALCLISPEKGTGKTFFCEHFGKLFGQHFKTVSQKKHLVGNFNSHLADCLLVNSNEAFWAGDKDAEGALKHLITEPYVNIEPKGKDIISVKNRIRFIFTSKMNGWFLWDLMREDFVYFVWPHTKKRTGPILPRLPNN